MVSKRTREMTSFIVMDVLEKACEMEKQGEHIIHLEVGEPDFDTPECVKESACKAINDGFTNIMGYSPSDVIGKSSLEINIWVNPEDREKLVAGLRKDGSIQNLEAPFRKKSGEQVTGLMSATIIELDQVPHILSITRDITNLKEDEKELKKYRDDLEEMVKNGLLVNVNLHLKQIGLKNMKLILLLGLENLFLVVSSVILIKMYILYLVLSGRNLLKT